MHYKLLRCEIQLTAASTALSVSLLAKSDSAPHRHLVCFRFIHFCGVALLLSALEGSYRRWDGRNVRQSQIYRLPKLIRAVRLASCQPNLATALVSRCVYPTLCPDLWIKAKYHPDLIQRDFFSSDPNLQTLSARLASSRLFPFN